MICPAGRPATRSRGPRSSMSASLFISKIPFHPLPPEDSRINSPSANDPSTAHPPSAYTSDPAYAYSKTWYSDPSPSPRPPSPSPSAHRPRGYVARGKAQWRARRSCPSSPCACARGCRRCRRASRRCRRSCREWVVMGRESRCLLRWRGEGRLALSPWWWLALYVCCVCRERERRDVRRREV